MRVVYNAFGGRFSDNPRALFEGLSGSELEHIWLADPDHLPAFPTGTVTVPVGSDEAVDALQTADLVVSNTHVFVPWTKSPRTTYLQTWHGTPLKNVHNDVLWAPPGRLARLDEDIARWDVLLSPNAASTPRLRKAFGFDGPVLETGYPRNDALSPPGAEEASQRVRADLGLAEEATAVLYAPTWRDDEGYRDDCSPVTMGLDLARVSEALGADVRILVRLHDLVTGRWRSEGAAGVVDVSYHPDIADLYLAADVLVTDYSSVMFDFAVTGKPIIFYAYDLEYYRDELRGLYFDLEPVAPGPVVRTPDAVVAAIVDREQLATAYAERYAAFRRTFCYLEDGHATQRVIAQGIEPLR